MHIDTVCRGQAGLVALAGWRVLSRPLAKAKRDKWGGPSDTARMLLRFATPGDILMERPKYAKAPKGNTRKKRTRGGEPDDEQAVVASAALRSDPAADDDDDDLRAKRRRKFAPVDEQPSAASAESPPVDEATAPAAEAAAPAAPAAA